MKYIVIADYVVSKNDGYKHYVTAKELIRLYGVSEEYCLMFNSYDSYQREKHRIGPNNFKILMPKFSGNYSMEDK